MKTPILAAVLAVTLALPLGAGAQNADDGAVAQTLFDEGVRLMKMERYGEACPKLEASLKHKDGLGTRGKLAECWEKAGRTASAWAQYKEVAVLAHRGGDDVREKVATERAAALEPKLAHLTIVAPATPGLVVKRNGEALEPGVFGAAIAVDPGEQKIEASAPGKKTWSGAVTAPAGANAKIDVPTLEDAPPEAQPGAPPPASGSRKTIGLVVAGVGGAAAIAGVVVGFVAKGQYDGAFPAHCDASKACDQTGYDATHAASGKATAATVLVIGGAVVAAAGVVVFVTAPKGGDRRSARVAPWIGPGAGGLAARGSF